METLDPSQFAVAPAGVPGLETCLPPSDYRKRSWQLGRGVLRFVERSFGFLPTDAPELMSQHFNNAEARNDPAPQFADPRG